MLAKQDELAAPAPAAAAAAAAVTTGAGHDDGVSERVFAPVWSLVAALLGFFVVTLDAVIVNVALPHIRSDLHSSISGLQWVVDGYTLMFAALLLTAGSLSDRVGARRAFAYGLALFVVSSAACGLAPSLTVLVAARFVQGSAAAAIMPASMALLTHAYSDPVKRVRAVGAWAMGGAAASASGPILGGLLTAISWRLIFFVNLPAGMAALLLLTRAVRSPRHAAPVDWAGQVTVMVGMAGLVFGVITTGRSGLGSPPVLIALGLALLSLGAFTVLQLRQRHPMMPPALFRSRTVSVSMAIGFAFMIGYYGLPFVMSLYFQDLRGVTALETGVLFLPMMIIGLILNPVVSRVTPITGARVLIISGLLSMSAGLAVIGLMPSSTPVISFALLMMSAGLAGPLVMPPTMALLLHAVPAQRAGVASGIFNTSRQVGGALAIAVFGALIAHRHAFIHGLRASVFIAAAVTFAAAAVSLLIEPSTRAQP